MENGRGHKGEIIRSTPSPYRGASWPEKAGKITGIDVQPRKLPEKISIHPTECRKLREKRRALIGGDEKVKR